MIHGIILYCSDQLIIEQVVFNSFNYNTEKILGSHLSQIFNKDDLSKVNNFISKLKDDSAVFGWDINVDFEDHIKPLKISGSRINGNYFIMGVKTNSDVPFLYEELIKINNEQANFIRLELKQKFLNKAFDNEHEAYDAMSKLNNELSKLQRELIKKNVELKKLNELKNQFLGMAAHDLRNPLGTVLNLSEFLLDERESFNKEQIDFIETINNSTSFMLNLVNELLDVSAIEYGKINLDKKDVDIRALISKIAGTNSILAAKKQIELIIDVPKDDIFLNIDKNKIEQVITNLITNAIKFSEPRTRVNITLERDTDKVIISVIDNSRGIAEDEITNLFQPFKKTSTKSTQGEKSTGLGLFIVKKMIDAHDGNIWVQSTIGSGSTFAFSLPYSKGEHV